MGIKTAHSITCLSTGSMYCCSLQGLDHSQDLTFNPGHGMCIFTLVHAQEWSIPYYAYYRRPLNRGAPPP